ncbi:hypothetical protein Sango_2436600 [Sesamum angolense]|uniref:RNase H type-1 domain-containing protein n=1 Tax=Sesamum angolense TaxID=2727404 RepID=A0AAE1W7N2_9LAMI|nr:hypothetical protein Sango_2436600 [Sesamum angolense]
MVVEGKDLLVRPNHGGTVPTIPSLISFAVSITIVTILLKHVGTSKMKSKGLSKMDIYENMYVWRRLEVQDPIRSRKTTKQKMRMPPVQTLFLNKVSSMLQATGPRPMILLISVVVSGAGVVVTSPHGEDLEFAVKFDFKASNNEVEYKTLLIGMKMAHGARTRHLVAYSDYQLEVKQVEDTYEAKEKTMIQYLQQIAKIRTSFESIQLTQIPREENIKADCLSKLFSSLEDYRTRHITIQYLLEPRAPLAVQAISSAED